MDKRHLRLFALFCLVLASFVALSSKAVGLLWLILLGTAMAAGWRTRGLWTGEGPVPEAVRVTRIWLGLTAAALALRSVGMLHWGDAWDERHAELRLMLTALALWIWGRKWNAASMAKFRPWLVAVTHGFAVACLLGLVQVWRVGREHLATHPIAWAVGVSLLSIWLLHSAVWRAVSPLQRWGWLAGGACGVLAVLGSQSRGAFGLVLWWLLVSGWLAWRQLRLRVDVRHLMPKIAGATVLLAVALLGGWQSGLLKRPAHALLQAQQEYTATEQQAKGAVETSFGARLYMWQRGWAAAEQSPFWGYGQQGRKALIHQWGREADSPLVMSLGHAHNQYLNDTLDHGAWGLASGLTYLAGLFGLAWWLLLRQKPFAGWTLAGVGFMHATSSLSNVNFAHNYYSSMLSLVVGLVLLSLLVDG